jgi:hypothetical protein
MTPSKAPSDADDALLRRIKKEAETSTIHGELFAQIANRLESATRGPSPELLAVVEAAREFNQWYEKGPEVGPETDALVAGYFKKQGDALAALDAKTKRWTQ